MHPDLATALRLQEIDLRILELRREIALLPRQIAEIEKQLEGHLKQLELDKANLAANQRERKQKDLDIQSQQQRISKLKDQMMGAKTNEQYRTFQNEIDYCEKEIRKLEDRILELMLQSEPLEANVRAAEGALAEEKKVVDGRKSEAKARTSADKAELDKLSAERKTATKAIPAQLLKVYEHLHTKNRDGVAVAQVAAGRCLACHMVLRPQLIQDLNSGELVACENCRRLLYIVPPPVDVAAEMQP